MVIKRLNKVLLAAAKYIKANEFECIKTYGQVSHSNSRLGVGISPLNDTSTTSMYKNHFTSIPLKTTIAVVVVFAVSAAGIFF
jgi:hypothetical protein